MNKILLATVLLISLSTLNAEFTKLQWKDLGSPEVEFLNLDVKPMPVVNPGTGTLTFQANFKRPFKGDLKTNLNIIRTVSGLKIPIRCYLAGGVYVGSCDYTDLCKIVQTIIPDSFTPEKCALYPQLLSIGIDCTCPFNVVSGFINIQDILVEVPDASQSIATFLASGDFDVTIKTSDPKGPIANLQVQFSVKPAGSG